MERKEKGAVIQEFRIHERDTGSSDVQIAWLTERINRLAEHFREHHHDYNSQRGILKLVGRRRRLLAYLSREEPSRYRYLIERLGLRK